MANITNSQILQEGPRNVVVKLTGELDTSDLAVTTVLTPATYNQGGTGPTPTGFNIQYIWYAIGINLELFLEWHMTTNVPLLPLAGRGRMDFTAFGGINSPGGLGANGAIDMKTQGWVAGTIQPYTIILEMKKIGPAL
jgi:hypothetical protein